MAFIAPMMASPIPKPPKDPRKLAKFKPFVLPRDTYIAQEKWDGVRIVAEIIDKPAGLFKNKTIVPWSRYGIIHPVPAHVEEELGMLRDCVVDGELLAPGKRSYGTLTKGNAEELEFYIFDLLKIDDVDLHDLPYITRRGFLESVMIEARLPDQAVHLAKHTEVNTWEEVLALRDEVWERDGEGLILKRKHSLYSIGKRPKLDWLKIKKLQSALVTVVGFAPSRGEIMNRGDYAIVLLRDDNGVCLTVKTKNDEQCRKFEEEARWAKMNDCAHPSLGRKLWIEYQEMTPYNEYREPRWDRWENE